MKSIWFVNEYDVPPEFLQSRRRYDMCKYLLRKNKYKLHVICGAFLHGTPNEFTYGENKKKNVKIDGVNIHILKGVKYKGNIKRIFSMLVFSIRLFFYKFPKSEKPDLIYSSSPHLFAALASYFLAKREKSKFILEIRDLWPETWVQMNVIKKNGIVHKMFSSLENFLYKKADKIIYLNSNFKYIIDLGIPKEKIASVSNGVDLEVFDKKSELIIKMDKEKFNITYTGSISIGDNVVSLLKLAKLLNNHNIIINIIGKGKNKEKLKKVKEEENINNVIFEGPFKKINIPEILRNSDLLVIPTLDIELYQYGISFNKLFEYWASKKPIIFFGKMSPDYIKESNSGITVSTGKIEDFKEAVLKIYNMSADEREKFGENGRKYVEKYFDWKILVNKVDKVIEEVLKGE